MTVLRDPGRLHVQPLGHFLPPEQASQRQGEPTALLGGQAGPTSLLQGLAQHARSSPVSFLCGRTAGPGQAPLHRGQSSLGERTPCWNLRAAAARAHQCGTDCSYLPRPPRLPVCLRDVSTQLSPCHVPSTGQVFIPGLHHLARGSSRQGAGTPGTPGQEGASSWPHPRPCTPHPRTHVTLGNTERSDALKHRSSTDPILSLKCLETTERDNGSSCWHFLTFGASNEHRLKHKTTER